MIFVDTSDWAYLIARLLGVQEKYADNIGNMVLALLALGVTSDWLYQKLQGWLDRRFTQTKREIGRQFFSGLRLGLGLLMALPKRTLLFSFYLLLTVLELSGLIQSAKDYAVIIIFTIAIDRVTKIWPSERERLRSFIKQTRTQLEGE